MAKNKSKNENKKVVERYEKDNVDNNLYGKLIVVLVVISILCIFYLLTLRLTSGDVEENDLTNEETVILYDEILVGSSFNRSDDKYFVVYYDMSNHEEAQEVSSAITKYESNEDALPVYTVDMSDVLNKKYVSSVANEKANKASDLRIDGVTLIRVKDGKLDKYLDGENKVV